ncbi:MAG TPA: hypothetical protein PK411_12190 [Mesotoga infera]|nr:hypothetical protein [Mesotoga sp.]HON29022.1 hypothetical protein [Mesotoga infera]HPD39095.1 hypothetical protein [Mesotoga infera]HRR45209.1 hypothetical protein [Mesotoga sp.]HRV02669.1 hypothetical protein [Mesotoga sp.]
MTEREEKPRKWGLTNLFMSVPFFAKTGHDVREEDRDPDWERVRMTLKESLP